MLLKNTFRKIKKSFGRYLSLLIIIMLGVGFFTGIKESIPNLKDTQTKYYEEKSLADIKILSEIGFTDADLKEMHLTGVKKVVGSYSKDVVVKEHVLRLHAIEDELNKYLLISGVIPTQSNECLADSDKYKVGDKITITDEYKDNLTTLEYTVVGTIHSPLYSTNEYDTSDIGNGKVHSFIFIPKGNFKYETYTEAYLQLDMKAVDVPYSEGYDLKIDKIINQLQVVKNERITERVDEIVRDSHGAISEESLKGVTWYFLHRNDFITAYSILGDQYGQVITIANVIPIFFILIVALMTSNTMTRMITEERGEMGTLLSLGYSNEAIIYTYLVYVLSATLLGAVSGYFIGTTLLPQIVYNCFPVNLPEMIYTVRLPLFITSILVACLLMIYVTVSTCTKELKSSPAYLLRPEPPKRGKKVFLEKINFIWSKLSFSSKVTIRNIARYKKRVIITLIAGMGCTFMIMIGLALKDSINTVGNKQFNDILTYDNLIVLNKNISELDEKLKEELTPLIKDEVLLNQTSSKVIKKDNSLDAFIFTPQDLSKDFYKYFPLTEVNEEKKIKLNNKGVVITPKIAERFKLEVGDEFTIELSNKKTYELKVSAITENYVSNYIYMTKEYYENIFGTVPTYNVIASTNKEEKDLAKKLLSIENVISVNFNEDLLKTANEAVKGLNSVVLVLVVISSLLAFTVLYNLTSINISERTREIATLKVLGFRDFESNEYIYRETLITTIVGIILGLIITRPLHNIVMSLLEVDHMVFLRTIKPTSYIFASVMTLLFAIIMQIVTYYKMKKINMIESLKSVE